MTMMAGRESALLLCALVLLAACSQHSSPDASSIPAKGAGGISSISATACDRQILKIDDVAGILSSPITGTQPLPGDAQSCEFVTASFPAIIVTVRPSLGRTTVEAWTSGKMPLSSSPLPGVGDAAVWVGALHEAVAQKNAVLCDIQVRGGGSDVRLTAQSLPDAVGSLCNKIFAAY